MSLKDLIHDPRKEYWTQRYETLDWRNGFHIGNFDYVSENDSLDTACNNADVALAHEILETCSLFRLVTNFRVLEIGCGAGGLALKLSETIPSLDYYGFDVSKSAIQSAINKMDQGPSQTRNNRPKFREGGINEICNFLAETIGELDSTGYDLVIIREVYYLFSDTERNSIRKAIVDSLRPGGFVYFADLFCASHDEQQKCAIDEHLYKRHHSRGKLLELSGSNEASLCKWFQNTWPEFEAIKTFVDGDSIEKTYAKALKPGESEENNRAFCALSNLAKKNGGGDGALIYGTGFLLCISNINSEVFSPEDFHVSMEKDFASPPVLREGNQYGAIQKKWNLLVGRSGAGKTSLLRALEGDLKLYVQTKGTRLFANEPYFFLAQSIDIFERLSPIENVQAFSQDINVAKNILGKLGLTEEILKRKHCENFSGGEKQRIVIAQCLASNPTVIILDEPMKGLDKARRAILFETLSRVLRDQEDGNATTLICVEHDFDSIYQRFDVVFEMLYGKQILVFTKEKSFNSRFQND